MTKAESLQLVADTHEEPFLIIDRESRIVAANRAFLDAYGLSREQVLGDTCYRVTHGSERPCHEQGEECPLQRIQETGEPYSCLHIHNHFDRGEHIHHVRVKGYPLYLDDDALYVGESMTELAVQDVGSSLDQCMGGRAKPFIAALEAMQQAARSDAPVLIQGETGTGKELAAGFIHQHSDRSKGPLLTLDCTVLTENLVESELFGHERGAFTGSVGDRQGLFKLADGGSLFLDEIGELPRQLQTKLLRVLESGEFRRVGGNRTIRSDVRIICATNRDLAGEVAAGNFREDLYYRLACLTVRLPSLRERTEDLPELAELLLRRIPGPERQRLKLTPDAVAHLRRHAFPGNVRELRNILQAAAAQATGNVIDTAMVRKVLSVRLGSPGVPPSSAIPPPAAPSADSMQEVERAHVRRLLAQYGGNRAAVARALGVTERTVYRRLKRLGLT